MKTIYDCHCHLFTRKETLNFRLLFEIIFGFPKAQEKGPEIKKSLTAKEPIFDRVRDKIHQLKHILNFLRTGFSDTEEDIFKQMQKSYGKELNIAPLMFDLECVFVANRFGGKVDFASHQEAILAEYDKVTVEFHSDNERFIEEATLFVSGLKLAERLNHDHSDLVELQKLHNELKNELEHFKTKKLQGQNLQLSLISNYDIQLNDISTLKAKYSHTVFPFIAIDPRREGIIDKFIKKIYKEGIFCGVKLYSPNGYSPTDKDLMKKGGLYDFCVKMNIPITAHNSFGGFATPLTSVEIDGFIYDNGLKEVHGAVKLSKPFTDDWVQERAIKFNHPDIWEKVMQAYPTLKLNLAHFGNGNADWQKKIFNLISNSEYPNLHTDLSCWCYVKDQSKTEIGLQTFYDKYYKKASDYVKGKFLYGSDFYLDLIYIDSLTEFYKNFKKVFPKNDLKRIAYTNAKVFLGLK